MGDHRIPRTKTSSLELTRRRGGEEPGIKAYVYTGSVDRHGVLTLPSGRMYRATTDQKIGFLRKDKKRAGVTFRRFGQGNHITPKGAGAPRTLPKNKQLHLKAHAVSPV